MSEVDRDALLPRVAKPIRYLGEEHNAVRKDHSRVKVTFALAFPDSYEVGMSHLGLRLLYDLLNRRDDCACERVFAPWPDMAAEMRRTGTPLWALESGRPVAEFDVLGISLQHELNFTNVLYLLDMAGIPARRAHRGPEHPLVVGGGPAAFNPEPLADFFDLFIVGDGELAAGQLVDMLVHYDRDRQGLLAAAAGHDGPAGYYVPAAFEPAYNADGTIDSITPRPGARYPVRRAVLPDLGDAAGPEAPIVPFTEIVHDRVVMEICRGCTRGCRFCQAGMIYRPVRERPLEQAMEIAARQLAATGHEEVSLASLSATDYSRIDELVRGLIAEHQREGIGVALPSLRIDAFSVGLAAEIQKVRKSGLTFAPEAGTERLRRVINKNVDEADLIAAVDAAFRQGWDSLKLYFMIGLPTETDQDILAIADLARKVWSRHQELRPGRGLRLAVSCASYVPKAHTPFQWEPQVAPAELERRQGLLRSAMPRRIKLNWHSVQQSLVEAALARGDRRLGLVIERVYAQGAKFDAWDDQFLFGEWMAAFAAEGLDIHWYANRRRHRDELLPWAMIDSGISPEWLWGEYERALIGEPTLDCREGACHECGVCGALMVAPRLATRATARVAAPGEPRQSPEPQPEANQ